MTTERVELDALVVGAGFNGLYQLHRLRAEGFAVHLVDAADEPGGVWAANRYPGARVDSHIPNYEYSLEEVWRGWNWSERFPGGDEIRAYFHHVARVLDLSRDISLNTRVTAARFDGSAHRWTVTTDTGQEFDVRWFITCTGFASKPYVPDIPGLDDFAGECHHTARWPAGLELAGKRVGIIGTGASGVQVVQEAGKVADELVVFQRSPVTAIPMRQQRYTNADHAALKEQYPRLFRERNDPPGSLTEIRRLDVGAMEVSEDERRAVFDEAWRRGGFHFWVGTFSDTLFDPESNRAQYDYWRARVHERVDDPAVAELLAPTEPPYPFGTKRPSLEQDYYEMFNRPNVRLVDLHTEPIVRVTADGIETAGGFHELDVLVLATGFDANTGGLTDIDLVGTDGRTIADHWADGVDTHLGMAVAGFPNLLFLYGPQSPTAFCNGPTCAELQGEWVVDFLRHLRAAGHTRFESTPESAAEWTAHLDQFADMTLLGKADSWYMSANVPGKKRQLLNYPSSDDYLRRLGDCAANGYDGFVIG